MRLDRVLHGERMQIEELGDIGELRVRRLVQPEPDESAAGPAHVVHGIDEIPADRHPDPVLVHHAVHHGGAER